mgnify:CR=1 FL=1
MFFRCKNLNSQVLTILSDARSGLVERFGFISRYTRDGNVFFFHEASPEYYSNAVLRTCFNERLYDKAFFKHAVR